MDNRWFVWVMNPIMHATRCMWKEPTGCCVRRSALYEDRERFKPYEKHHSTALDAGRLAAQLGVKNLLLYTRKTRHWLPVKSVIRQKQLRQFSGKVYVPDDLEEIYYRVMNYCVVVGLLLRGNGRTTT